MIRALPSHITSVIIQSGAAKTSTYNTSSVDLKDFIGEVFIYLDIGTCSGTPTLDAAVNDSANDSSFAALSPALAFPQKTATGQAVLVLDTRACRRYVRLACTIGGGTPSMILSISLHGRKQAAS